MTRISGLAALMPLDRPEEYMRARRRLNGQRGAMVRHGRWMDYLNTFGSHERDSALFRVAWRISDDATYWRVLSDVWVMGDVNYHALELWRMLLSAPRPGREFMMDDAGCAAFAALPETVTAYRGFRHPGGERGLSWTTDRERAEWFATQFATSGGMAYLNGRAGGRPMLATVVVPRSAVIAACVEREESELLNPDAPDPVVFVLTGGV